MKAAYADPPYLGCGVKHYGALHPDAADYDRIETHAALISRLDLDYDAWALSLSTPSLKAILRWCPDDIRVGSWVKSFASFKPNVNPAYAWEPVIFRRCRDKRSRSEPTVRDWISEPITLKRGLTGAKPERVCWWIFDMLGLRPDDELDDLFPGSGAVGRAWDVYRTGHSQRPLFVGLDS